MSRLRVWGLAGLLCLWAGCDALRRIGPTREDISCTRDSDCYRDLPVCQSGQCVSCTTVSQALGDAACRGQGRVCAPPSMDGAGACVECRTARDCHELSPQVAADGAARARACWYGTCVDACSSEAECASAGNLCETGPVVEVGVDWPAGRGACIPADEVFTVDNSGAPCGSGTHCNISKALLAVGSRPRAALRLLDSRRDYDPIRPDLPAGLRVLAVYGPPQSDFRKLARLAGSYGALDVVAVRTDKPGQRMRLILDSVQLVDGLHGLLCDGWGAATTQVVLRKSTISGSRLEGLRAESCRVNLDRVRVEGSRDSALSLRGTTTFAVSNSLIVDNTPYNAAVLALGGATSGEISYSTIAGNNSARSMILACDEGPGQRLLARSLLVKNRTATGSLQAEGVCGLRAVIVDDATRGGIPGAPLFESTGLAGDYRLTGSESNRACCIDQGGADPQATHDFFGGARPLGRGFDYGAHEVTP